MRYVLMSLVVLAGCQRSDPLYCGKHPGVCDDGGNFLIDAAELASIGGNVSGLGTASGLVLQNNGGDDKPVLSDGAFRFPTQIQIGTGYDVMVSVQPTNPSEMCVVSNGTGTAATDVSNIDVSCASVSYTIGGSVVGLSGSVTLHNGGDALNIGTNGMFMFPTKVMSGQPYNVTATGNAACTVFGGTGTVGNNNVTSVVVNCASGSGPYVIGGMISGLNGSVVLQNSDNGDQVTLSSNGTYAFPMPVPSAGAYNVTVKTQPGYPPAKQNCVVANGMSTANGNVQNINVTCTTLSFSVGGMISGITGTGTFTLQNNLADNLPLTTDGPFTFATPLLSGTPFNVTVATKPPTRTCMLTGATGTVTTSNVTSVSVACSYQDPGIKCGSSFCTTSMACCDPSNSSASCAAMSSSCPGSYITCDSKSDCGSKVCCVSTSGGSGKLDGATCQTSCSSGPLLCDPNASNPCAGSTSGTTCSSDSNYGGYPYCH